MRIHGYPGERVDFVSGSGSAGAIFFGDSQSLVEEFFGPPHRAGDNAVSYFNDTITIHFSAHKVSSITVRPGRPQETVQVFAAKEELGVLNAAALADAAARLGFAYTFSTDLEAVTFS